MLLRLTRVLCESLRLWPVTDLLRDQTSTLIATIWDSTSTDGGNKCRRLRRWKYNIIGMGR